MNHETKYYAEDKSSQEIARDIYRTQDRIDNRMTELRQELTSDRLIGAVLSKFGINSYSDGARVAGSKAKSIKSALKNNPAATTLVSSGLFVGILNSLFDNFRVEDALTSGANKSRRGASKAGNSFASLKDSIANFSQRTGERLSGAQSNVSSSISDRTSSLGDSASSTRDAAAEKAAVASEFTKEKASQAGQYANENPLAVGLGLFAVGLAISTLAPRTRTEDELIGEHADRLKEDATKKAAEAVSETREKTKKHAERIKSEETEDSGLPS